MYRKFLKRSGRMIAFAVIGTMLLGSVPVYANEVAGAAQVEEKTDVQEEIPAEAETTAKEEKDKEKPDTAAKKENGIETETVKEGTEESKAVKSPEAVTSLPLNSFSYDNEVLAGNSGTQWIYIGNSGSQDVNLSDFEIKVRGTAGSEGVTLTLRRVQGETIAANTNAEVRYDQGIICAEVDFTVPVDCKAPVIKFVLDFYEKSTSTKVYTTQETCVYPFTVANGVLTYNDTSKDSKYELKVDLGEHIRSEGLVGGSGGDATEIWDKGQLAAMYLRPGYPSHLLLQMDENYIPGKPELVPASAGTVKRNPAASSPIYIIDLHAPATLKIRTGEECVLEHASGMKFVADGITENDMIFSGLSLNVQKYENENDFAYVREEIEPFGEIQAYTATVAVPDMSSDDFKVKLEGNAPRLYIPIPSGWNAEKTGLFVKTEYGIYETTGEVSEDGNFILYHPEGFAGEFHDVTVTFGLFQKSTSVDAKLWKQVAMNYLIKVRPVNWATGITFEAQFFEETPLANVAAWYTLTMEGHYKEYQEENSSKRVIPYEVLVKDAQKYFGNLPDMKQTALDSMLVYDAGQNAFVYQPGMGGDKNPEVKVERVDDLGSSSYAIRFQFSDEDYPATEATLVVQDNKEGNWKYLSFLKGYPEVRIPEEPKPETPTPEEPKPETPAPEDATQPTLENPNKGEELSKAFIAQVEETIASAKSGSVVTVAMNGATTVPASVLETVKGKDVSLILNMGNYSWKIKGKDVTAEALQDVDLKVTVGTKNIPAKVVQTVGKDKESMQISLAHNGAFGFKAELSISVGEKNKGRDVSLYYYNEKQKLELVEKSKAAQDGTVTFTFEHASEYVAVIEKVKAAQEEKDQVTNGSEVKSATPETGDHSNVILWGVLMTLSGILIVLGNRRKRA